MNPPHWMSEPEVLRELDGLLTIRDVAERLSVSQRTVRRWAHEGQLETIKLGESPHAPVRVSPRALLAFARITDRSQEES